ncbi:MAG TPA: TonB-dependent receptor [Blastocatellia bacterium]|nr:TonB-dependent receptor [Blastocatellia bacterium]
MSNLFFNRRLTRLLAGLALILTTSPLFALAATAGGGRLEGSVTDPSGAKIVGALVALRDRTGKKVYEARTDGEGKFSVSNITAGRYAVTAEADGFSQEKKIDIDVREAEVETLTVELTVAAITDHVIVTATRTETQSSILAGSVSVFASEEIDRRGLSSISEPLRLIPGFAVAQTGGRGGLTSVFVRGGESDYNKVLIDGVPVNAAGGAFDFATLTPENFERVEAVRGPRSALFGSDAMTSVVQLVTRRGSTPTPELELSGEGGSFDFHRETARLSGLRDWFDYSGSFGFLSTDSRFENSDYINRSASANLGFRLAPTADLRLTSRWNNNTLGVPGPAAFLFVDPDQRQKHRDLSVAAAFDHRTTSRWSQTARLVYSEFDTNSFDPAGQDLTRPDRPPLPPFAFFPDSAFKFIEHQRRQGIHYQSIAALTASNVLTAGLDFERESGVFTDDFSRVSPDRNNLGFYVQDQLSWRERLFLTAGVRIERNTGSVPDDLRAALASLGSTAPIGDVGFGVEANPKVAVTVIVRPHSDDVALGATRLKAGFGTGIKEPSLLEAFSPSTFFLGNPSLDPERAKSFDVGVVQEFFNRKGSVEVTYFDNRFRDLIVFTSDPVTFGPVRLADGRLTNFINLDRASARGVELITAARPLRQIRVMASYTFLRSRVEQAEGASNMEVGLPLLRRPRHSGSFEAVWTEESFDITVDGSLVGRRRDFDPVTFARFDAAGRAIFNDGYSKLNASGAYRLKSPLTLFARVENLLNQDYQEVFGFPAYRLNFTAGLRVRIGKS